MDAAALKIPRLYHTATLLDDGRVLVVGGIERGRQTSRTGELYDPTKDTWTPTAPMQEPEQWHAALKLSDGRVLISGGALTPDDAQIYAPSKTPGARGNADQGAQSAWDGAAGGWSGVGDRRAEPDVEAAGDRGDLRSGAKRMGRGADDEPGAGASYRDGVAVGG